MEKEEAMVKFNSKPLMAVLLLLLALLVAACDIASEDDESDDSGPSVRVATYTPGPGQEPVDVELNTVDTGVSTPASETNQLTDMPDYASELRTPLSEVAIQLADFTLPADTESGEFTLSDYQGKVVLVYFGYTFCPDICPLTMTEINQVYQELDQPEDKLAVIFVSIDPERDTPERLDTYLDAFSQDFIGVSTQDEVLQTVMEQFGAVAIKREVPESAAGYLMDHTGSVFIVDPDGRLLGRFPTGTGADTIQHDLNIIFEEEF